MDKPSRPWLSLTVWVAAFGYFVDVYDLVLFGVLRTESLTTLGYSGSELLAKGAYLLNWQMAGTLIGGFFWGYIGDRFGRLSILFGSIATYSLANLANALVWDLHSYAVLRLIAGIGLAGGLGSAVTLVSEVLPTRYRGLGTTLIGSIGLSGALTASFLGGLISWRYSYAIGGMLGLTLLLFRFRVQESGMFTRASEPSARMGDLRLLFKPSRFLRFCACFFLGVPTWYAMGVLIYFSPEIGRELGLSGPVVARNSILFGYAGAVIGSALIGLLSQAWKSRKKVLYLFLGFSLVLVEACAWLRGASPAVFYGFCFCLGIALGYAAIFVTVSAEQFGTNLRATVTTSVPNLVRAAVIPLLWIFQLGTSHFGMLPSIRWIGWGVILLAMGATWLLKETFDRDLEFTEA